MTIEMRRRNNDVGLYMPSANDSFEAVTPDNGAAAAAPVIVSSKHLMTPHMPNANEVVATMHLMEQEAERQSMEIIEMHSGLNEMRVKRLLGLLQ